MKKLGILGILTMFATSLRANPACTTLCPLVLGASLGIARKLGVSHLLQG